MAARGLGILVFPILVAQLNETELVNYDWVLTNIMLSLTFSVFGVDSAAGRILANKNVNRVELRDSSFSIILPQTFVTMAILFFYIKMSGILIQNIDLLFIFLLLVSSIIVNQVTNTAKWLLQRNNVIKIQMSLGLLQASFLYLTYLIGVMNFTTALASQMAGAACSACYGLYLNKGGTPKFKFSRSVKTLFKKSSILGVNTVLASLYLAVEKNIIYKTASSYEASSYLVHLKVVLLFSFALSALQISLAPHLIKILQAEQISKFLISNLIVLIFVLLCGAIFILMAPVIFELFSQKHFFNFQLMKMLLIIQVLIIFVALCETFFIFLEKYKSLLFLNFVHLFVFVVASLYSSDKNIEIIILIALISLALKLTLMLISNVYYLSSTVKKFG